MHRFRALLLAVCALYISGCTTIRITEPPQTATEQLLVTGAVDRAVAVLDPQLPAHSTVFLDTQYYDLPPSDTLPKYTVAALRARLTQLGLVLVDDRDRAKAIIELRSGAQSIDHKSQLVGLPSIPIPIPLTGTIATPQIALFAVDRQTGIAKLGLHSYWTATGAPAGSPIAASEFGKTNLVRYTVLFVSWTRDDVKPPE